jgi:filamentous hemagglutinin family protein
MTASSARDRRRAIGRGALGCGMFFCSLAALAQVPTVITPDATLNSPNTPSSVSQAGAIYNINGGTAKGSNLFHSFSQFDVGTGATANFNTASNIANIVSRVTGNVGSQIDGTLTATDIGTGLRSGANLFLMNPAGIIFGENARLDLGGSFHATTADYIKFGSETFHADPTKALGLSSAPPSAFGFLTANPGEIKYSSPSLNFLHVADGNTLSLVGGNITIGDSNGPGILIAVNSSPDEAASVMGQIGGRINLVSVASAGEAPIAGSKIINIDTTSFPQLGNITIQNGSVIDAREIVIRSGQLVVSDAFVFPGGVPRMFGAFEQPNGGMVDIDVRNTVAVSGSDFIFNESPGIRTWSGSISDFSLPTDAPDIAIKAGTLSITGTAIVGSERFGPGNAADITINVDLLEIRNGGSLLLRNAYCNTCSVDPESSGSITVNAQQMLLSGDGHLGLTGITAQGEFHQGYFVFSGDPVLTSADSGTITVNVAGSLTMRGAEITTDAPNFGRSADITVNAGDLFMSDRSVIAAQSLFAGEAGNVRVNATRDISMSGGSRISVSTASSGNGGIVDVRAGRSIRLSGQDTAIFGVTVPVPDLALDNLANIFGLPTFADLAGALGLDPATATIFDVMDGLNQAGFAAVADLTPGDGGRISIRTPQLSLSDRAVLSTSTLWGAVDAVTGAVYGNAGQIDAHVTSLTVASGGEIRSRSGGIRLDNNQPAVGPGNAGAVTVSASDAITVTGQGSTISTTTFGDGKGGNLELSAGNQVVIVSGGRVVGESGGILGGGVAVGSGSGGSVSISAGNSVTVSDPGSIVSTTTFGDGAGGSVALTAAQVNIQNGGQVASQSGGMLGGVLTVGAGDAGTVTINATGTNTLTISGPGSTVSTTTLGAGDGGDVILTSAGDVRILSGGSVTSDSLGGAGFTGTIEITAGNSITLNNGTISTRAVTSDGGNIKLTAPNVIQLEGSQITTSVESGVGGGGNINIDPQFVLVNNSSIIANAFGGPGGNITIIAQNFLSSATSIIEASSALSTPGVIEIRSPENNVENNIAQLPVAFIDASALLRGLCSARRTGAPSSFVIAGRGGVPLGAEGYLPSFGTDVAAAVAGTGDPMRAAAGLTGEPPLVFALLANTLDCAR